jgi:RNA 2',3'-cyclic 3'-phosphodiesterase
MRLFIGVALDRDLSSYLSGWSQRLALVRTDGLRLISPEYYHLTLVFLGSHPESVLPAFSRALSRVGTVHSPFSCQLDGTALLPDESRPRALVANVEPQQPLLALRQDLYRCLDQLQLPSDGHEFRPHITLARSSPRRSAAPVQGLERDKQPLTAILELNSITLYQSFLHPDGSRYRPLVQVALAAGQNNVT